jgi:hypothetical protein
MTDAVHDALRGLSRPGYDDAPDMYTALAGVLWRERECLEQLLFRLVAQQLLLATGNTRWLHQADQEVHAAADALREIETSRAAQVTVLAQVTGLPLDVTLAELVADAGEPWTTILADHLTALRGLAGEVKAATSENELLLQAGEHAIHLVMQHTDDNLAAIPAPRELQ